MTFHPCAGSSCPARAFLSLARKRFSTVATSPTMPSSRLDFLMPHTNLNQHVGKPAISPLHKKRASYSIPMSAPRNFSTSSSRNTTVCVQNPQQDEDGNDMKLEITPRAAKRLSDIMRKDANPSLALRIQVESGGCHGFQYLMSLVTIPSKDATETSTVVNKDDSIFEFVPDEPNANSTDNAAPRIILDEPSLDLLKGSKVDFTMELIGSQFKIVDNPLATSSCGCGTSFDIKM